MDVDDYADQIMDLIATERARGFFLASTVNLSRFYLVKAAVPADLKAAVAEEVARRLRDLDTPQTS